MEDNAIVKSKFYIIFDFAQERYGKSSLMNETRKLLDKAIRENSTVRIRRINKELDTWLNEMFTPAEKNELLERMGQRGIVKDDYKAKDKIDSILKRGYIKSVIEYKFLSENAERLSQTGQADEMLVKVNKLLTEFMLKKEAKG